MKSGYAGNLRRKHQHNCQGIIVAHAENIHGTVNNLKQTGSLFNKQKKH
jgi:hypothetical protein